MANKRRDEDSLLARNRQRMANTGLTEQAVRAIRKAVDSGESTVKEQADLYDLGLDSIRKIVRRERFRWVLELDEVEKSKEGSYGLAGSGEVEALKKRLLEGVEVQERLVDGRRLKRREEMTPEERYAADAFGAKHWTEE